MHPPSDTQDTATTSAESDSAIMAILFRKPGFLLARIDQIATALYARRQPMTTLAQSELLLLLGRHGAMPQIALARAAGMDKSTVGLVLDNLEARQWIARTTCAQDRRRAQISLTVHGTAALAGIAGDFAELQRELLAPLAAEDRERLIDILAGLKANPRSAAPALADTPGTQDVPSFLFRRALQHLQAAFAALNPDSRATLRQFALLYCAQPSGCDHPDRLRPALWSRSVHLRRDPPCAYETRLGIRASLRR